MKEKLSKNKFLNMLITDYSKRTTIFTLSGTIINIVFTIFFIVEAYIYKSPWLGAFGLYYLILSFQKVFILIFGSLIKKKYKEEVIKYEKSAAKLYLFNGFFLLILNTTIIFIVLIITYKQPVNIKDTITAIAIATYTFYKFGLSIYNIVKAKKKQDYVILTIRSIAIIDALISMLSLTITLISTFGEIDESMFVIILLFGIFICLFTTILSIMMIVRGIKAIIKTINMQNKHN